MEQIEARIHRAEERQKEVSALLADEAVYSDTEKSFPLMEEYGRLQDTLTDLVEDPVRREEMGAGARRFVEEGRGATESSALLVLELLEAGGG